jgi:hypothetical protein
LRVFLVHILRVQIILFSYVWVVFVDRTVAYEVILDEQTLSFLRT